MTRLLAAGLLRSVHAWAWTAVWLIALERAILAYRIDPLLAGVLAVLFMPLVHLPLLAWRADRADDALKVEGAPFGVGHGFTFVACAATSALLLAFLNFLAHWDKGGPGSGAALFAAVALHVLATLSIVFGERWFGLRQVADD